MFNSRISLIAVCLTYLPMPKHRPLQIADCAVQSGRNWWSPTTPQTFLSWLSPAHQFDEARAAASLVLVSLLVASRAQDIVTRRCCRCCPVFKGVERLPQTYDVRCASYLVVCAQATATCHCGAYVGRILLNFCEHNSYYLAGFACGARSFMCLYALTLTRDFFHNKKCSKILKHQNAPLLLLVSGILVNSADSWPHRRVKDRVQDLG